MGKCTQEKGKVAPETFSKTKVVLLVESRQHAAGEKKRNVVTKFFFFQTFHKNIRSVVRLRVWLLVAG
jgi:hypothetical protein